VTGQYPELASLATAIDAQQAVMDGKIVVADDTGHADFDRLMGRMRVEQWERADKRLWALLPSTCSIWMPRLTRVARVNTALSQWGEIDCQALLPADLRRPVGQPQLSRAALKGLQIMLSEEIRRVETGFQIRIPFSLN